MGVRVVCGVILVLHLICTVVCSTFQHNENCIASCSAKPSGTYADCRGCRFYLACMDGRLIGQGECEGGKTWDDNVKNCVYESSTCDGLDVDSSAGCASNPCMYGGKCHDNFDGSYHCQCVRGARGNRCQDWPYCSHDPCKNGGTCSVTKHPWGGDKPRCECPPGYEGQYCERRGGSMDHRPCARNPCHNGQCRPEGNSYYCTCDLGWSGYHCESQVDSVSMQGRSFGSQSSQPRRTSSKRKRGKKHRKRHDCRRKPCQNDGRCRKTMNGNFRCDCPVGFNGTMCENEEELDFGPGIMGRSYGVSDRYCSEVKSEVMGRIYDSQNCWSDLGFYGQKPITGMRIWEFQADGQTFVRSIAMRYGNQWTSPHPHTDLPHDQSYEFEPDEWLTEIQTKAGHIIDGIKLKTTKREYGDISGKSGNSQTVGDAQSRITYLSGHQHDFKGTNAVSGITVHYIKGSEETSKKIGTKYEERNFWSDKMFSAEKPITGIRIWEHSVEGKKYVRSIATRYGSQWTKPHPYTALPHDHSYEFEPDERLTQIKAKAGWVIDGFMFKTSVREHGDLSGRNGNEQTVGDGQARISYFSGHDTFYKGAVLLSGFTVHYVEGSQLNSDAIGEVYDRSAHWSDEDFYGHSPITGVRIWKYQTDDDGDDHGHSHIRNIAMRYGTEWTVPHPYTDQPHDESYEFEKREWLTHVEIKSDYIIDAIKLHTNLREYGDVSEGEGELKTVGDSKDRITYFSGHEVNYKGAKALSGINVRYIEDGCSYEEVSTIKFQ